MIKIIKHGTTFGHKATCPSCQCMFTYDNADVQTVNYYKARWIEKGVMSFDNVYDKYIKCPECDETIILAKNLTDNSISSISYSIGFVNEKN